MGSSPLARGLHPRGRRAGRARGIIPARAGFTDHARRLPGRLAGSSPLARGLLCLSVDSVGDVGIIPARAGFTGQDGWRGPGSEDHPRSRGVYGRPGWPHSRTAGSSPLARGLQILAWLGQPYLMDHPRSRGVYDDLLTIKIAQVGSSPLARGLPARPLLALGRPGIIPARAGFTRAARSAGLTGTDHPRSRGVYVSGASSWVRRVGSSPLARGLP